MKIVMLFLVLTLAGCASTPGQIDTRVSDCCGDGAYETFEVKAERIPAFLGPLVVSNFSVAMAQHGYQPVEEKGDLVAILRYEQINLSDTEDRADAFAEPLGMDAEQRFIARIAIDLQDATTGESVFTGYVQRLHDIDAGEWMHTGVASRAIYLAFDEVLADLP